MGVSVGTMSRYVWVIVMVRVIGLAMGMVIVLGLGLVSIMLDIWQYMDNISIILFSTLTATFSLVPKPIRTPGIITMLPVMTEAIFI